MSELRPPGWFPQYSLPTIMSCAAISYRGTVQARNGLSELRFPKNGAKQDIEEIRYQEKQTCKVRKRAVREKGPPL